MQSLKYVTIKDKVLLYLFRANSFRLIRDIADYNSTIILYCLSIERSSVLAGLTNVNFLPPSSSKT